MTGLVLAALGAYGVHLLFTSLVFGWAGVGPGPTVGRRRRSRRVRD